MEEWQIQLLKDSKLIKILDQQFDEEKFVLDVLNRSTPSELSEIFSKLSHTKQEISQSFSNTIKENYNRLIDDFQNIKELNFEITDCRVRVQSIQKMLTLINSNFIQNYENIENKAPILKNTASALTLTKSALDFLRNLKKLKSIVGNKLEIYDLNKACLIIKDIIKVISEQNLDGVEFYERERDFIDDVRDKVIAMNDKKFHDGIAAKNVVEITHCIQNFYNLRILTERVQTAASTMMKSIFELWNKCVNAEYEKPYNGLIVLGNNIRSLLQEQLNYHSQIWLVSTILRKRDSNSLDSFFEYMKEGKIVNLYDEVWKKQIVIMNYHLKQFKEDTKGGNENNRLLFIRIYPKMHFLFEEFLQNLSLFMLKYPDPHEIKDMIVFRESFLEPLIPFADLYFQSIQTNLDQRLQTCISFLYNADSSYFKNYTNGILSETAKVGQLINSEIKENIKTASIFRKFGSMAITAIHEHMKSVFQSYKNLDSSKLSLNRLFGVFTYQFEFKKILTTIVTQKFNEELDLKTVDDLFNLCEKYEGYLLDIIFQTLFENSYQIIKPIYSFYQQELSSSKTTNNHHPQINQLKDFLINYSVASNQRLESCLAFVEYWNKLIFVILEILALIFSSFSEKNNRLIELTNKDVENFGYVLDALNKKETSQRLLLVNIQKLILVDAPIMKFFIENQHELIKNLPKPILVFNFLKRTEREAETFLYNIQGTEEEKGLDDIFRIYYKKEEGQEAWTLNEILSELKNFDSLKDTALSVIQRTQEKEGYHSGNVPSIEILSLILELN